MAVSFVWFLSTILPLSFFLTGPSSGSEVISFTTKPYVSHHKHSDLIALPAIGLNGHVPHIWLDTDIGKEVLWEVCGKDPFIYLMKQLLVLLESVMAEMRQTSCDPEGANLRIADQKNKETPIIKVKGPL